MTHPSEAVRQRLRYNLDARLEAIWAAARGDGHAACEGYTFDPRDPRLICACGEVLYEEGIRDA